MVPFLEDNPYQKALATGLRDHGVEVATHWTLAALTRSLLGKSPSPNVIHLHWLPRLRLSLAGLWGVLGYVLRIRLLRLFGRRFVWTVHNLYHHEMAWQRGERWLTRRVFAMADRIIVHSPIARDLVIREFKVRRPQKIAVVSHGNYIGCYANTVSRADARLRLELEPAAVVFLFFGQIRTYKGVSELVAAFRQLAQPEVRLVVAGKPVGSAALAGAERSAGPDKRITLRPGFVPDDQVQLCMAACDVVVFPYHDVLTSGAVILAMSFGRACIAPRLGCIPDVLDARGAFLYDPDDAEGLHQALSMAVQERDRFEAMGRHNLERAKNWDWDGIARQTAAVYADALRR